MKVCFISPSLSNGIGIYTERIANNLTKRDIKTSIITPESLNHKNIYYNFGDTKKINNQLIKIKPNIVHVQYDISNYKLFSFELLKFLKKVRKKINLVITFHEVKRDTDKLGFFGLRYYQFLSTFFDQIYVHTNEAANILKNRCYVPIKKIKIISHGSYKFKSKKDLRDELIKKYNLKDKKLLLYFGYIHTDKGINDAITAFNILLRTNPHYRKNTILLIVGKIKSRKGLFKFFQRKDEQYLTYLHELVKEYKLEKNVLFLGFIKEEEIYSLFNISKIILMPYTNVEQSGVLNIAIASNRPVIASNLGGLKETLKSVGILVPPKKPKEIAIQIKRLFEDKKDYDSLVKKYNLLNKSQSSEVVASEAIKLYDLLLKK